MFQSIKERRSTAIEKMGKEYLDLNEKQKLLAKKEKEERLIYLSSKKYEIRKILFFIGLCICWIGIWVYTIFSKKLK